MHKALEPEKMNDEYSGILPYRTLTESEALIIWLDGYFSLAHGSPEYKQLLRNTTIRILEKHKINIFHDLVTEG